MALVNPILYRLSFRRSWIYQDNLFFTPSTYSSFAGGAYFLPYFFKRLFERRQFREIETFLSHFVVKRFNNNTLYYQFFIQSRFFLGFRKDLFGREYIPHMFQNRRMSEGKEGLFVVRFNRFRSNKGKFRPLNSKIARSAAVLPVTASPNKSNAVSLKLNKQVMGKKNHSNLPSDRLIRSFYNKLMLEMAPVSSQSLVFKHSEHFRLVERVKAALARSKVVLKASNKEGSKKKKPSVSFFNKKDTVLGRRIVRKTKLFSTVSLNRLTRKRFLAFQQLIRFFEYYTRVFIFAHYKAAVLKTISSYFQNHTYKYVINFRFLAFRQQNIYQMLRFMSSRLAQGGNIKRLISSTQRFYETRGRKQRMDGIKLICSGRFSRQQRAQRLIAISGKVPANTISAKIDYALLTLRLKYGTSTIKMWISYK